MQRWSALFLKRYRRFLLWGVLSHSFSIVGKQLMFKSDCSALCLGIYVTQRWSEQKLVPAQQTCCNTCACIHAHNDYTD